MAFRAALSRGRLLSPTQFMGHITRYCNTLASTGNKPVMSYVEHPYQLNKKESEEGISPSVSSEWDTSKFAVVEYSGTQYKVTPGDNIIVNKIEDFDIGQPIELDKVLLVGSAASTYIGRPYITGAKVRAVMEEQLKDAKVMIFKKRRRKNTQKLRGYRRTICVLRIESIVHDTEVS
mmetsp:Transcript_22428/g.32709  ORF Transcript_22428/g.32709 Transcript_22428/m.32709 type:complete len:177 (+) Transcript_22428:84-614(+)|eukprot:CAMPEP_0185020732 /NCGR_PEP_ID=MMETSP1103-20130426/3372_1 /TAXON_ID=36769 /ORGANISM="Paraphysomonas bandaiensis, Strain Caron Lab Isolate" /LENGTH=176 /DNA_ID=CAMNT_0027551815 /DNA_START=67 /DNA_END=597 /DNA_ORIENTATION=-